MVEFRDVYKEVLAFDYYGERIKYINTMNYEDIEFIAFASKAAIRSFIDFQDENGLCPIVDAFDEDADKLVLYWNPNGEWVDLTNVPFKMIGDFL